MSFSSRLLTTGNHRRPIKTEILLFKCMAKNYHLPTTSQVGDYSRFIYICICCEEFWSVLKGYKYADLYGCSEYFLHLDTIITEDWHSLVTCLQQAQHHQNPLVVDSTTHKCVQSCHQFSVWPAVKLGHSSPELYCWMIARKHYVREADLWPSGTNDNFHHLILLEICLIFVMINVWNSNQFILEFI